MLNEDFKNYALNYVVWEHVYGTERGAVRVVGNITSPVTINNTIFSAYSSQERIRFTQDVVMTVTSAGTLNNIIIQVEDVGSGWVDVLISENIGITFPLSGNFTIESGTYWGLS